MCGISGVVSISSEQVLAGLDAQLACQRHRGPDAAGHFAGRRGVIAQNRLPIIDLVTGDPPITNENDTIGAVLNGEIYNFQALREELSVRRHRLSTDGDTEVLVHLAEETDALAIAKRIDGMFAFAIWDRAREKLILGRDRFGKKPLHYWNTGGTLVFASEIKGVLAHPCVPRRLNERAISAYLTFGYVPTPETFYAGIKSVPPGHVLTVEPGGKPVLERYWEPSTPDKGDWLDLSLDEAAAETRRLLEAAIRRRLVSDVPLGAFLSGGIDSSAIVALMASTAGKPVKTFTIGFDDRDGFDERPYARAVANWFGTEHREEVAHPDTIELIERLIWHHDQPFGDSSAIPTFLLNASARREVTVALSGDGGDELFAGYERFAAGLAMARLQRLPASIRQLGPRVVGVAPEALLGRRKQSMDRFVAGLSAGMPGAYMDWVGFVPEDARRTLLRRRDDWAQREYQKEWETTAGEHPLDRLLALNLKTYLVDDLLVKADRMSMAHGLEVRSPFLDTELAEFAARLRPGLKLRGSSMKRVLKRAVAPLLPEGILNRPKRGFGVPLDRWFRTDLRSYASARFGSDARLREHLNGDELDRLLAEHNAGQQDHGQELWTLLTLELWLAREGW